jgi:hypothetical protein
MMMLDLDAIRLHLLNDFRLTTPNDSQARDACCQALAQVIAEDEQLRAEVAQLRAALEKLKESAWCYERQIIDAALDVRRQQAERETED